MALPKIYKDFYEQKLFTSKDIREKYKQRNTIGSIKVLLHKCKVNGYLGSVKKGLYYIIPQGLSKGNYNVNKYLIASKSVSNAVISYHSALELHGVAQSVFNEVYILTKDQSIDFDFQGVKYRGVRSNPGFGYVKIIREGVPLLVTDRERTIIDGIDRLKYVGGLEEYLKSIGSFPSVDFNNIEKYLAKYNKVNLYSKVGFVLSLFEKKWSFPVSVRKKFKSKATNKVYYLTQVKGKGKLNKEWNLMVPDNIQEVTQYA